MINRRGLGYLALAIVLLSAFYGIGAILLAAPANQNRFKNGGVDLLTGGDGYSIGGDVQLYRSAANTWSAGAGDSLIGLTDLNATDAHLSNLYANTTQTVNASVTNWLNSTYLDTHDLFLQGYNVTELLYYAEQGYSYLVWGEPAAAPTMYYAKNGHTGKIDYSGITLATVHNNVNTILKAGRGGIIFYKPGNYAVTAPLTVSPYVSVIGSGYLATLFTLVSGSNCNIFNGDTAPAAAARLGIYMAHFSIEGNKATQAGTSNGIRLENYRNSLLEYIRIDNCLTNGVLHTTGFQISFKQIWSYGNGVSGFSGDSISNDYFEFFLGNTNVGDGIKLDTCYECVFIHCQGETNTENGFNIILSHNDKFIGCMAATNTKEGFRFYGSYDEELYAPLSSTNTRSGITVDSSGGQRARYIKILNGQITSNTRYGIEELNNGGAGNPYTNNYSGTRIQSNVMGQLILLSTDDMIQDIVGFVTESSGSATITAATLYANVTHGLAYTPAAGDVTISLGAGGSYNCTSVGISYYGATYFTIRGYDNTGTNKTPSGNITVNWKANKP